tara:strand:+ start:6465 stop:7718 length:1254 start_codon:yes stop_codon:yes gene_type:complete
MSEMLLTWKNEGVVEQFFFTPDPRETFKFHMAIWKLIPQLKKYTFDLWLATSDTLPSDRYMSDYVLPSSSIRIVIWPYITYLFWQHSAFSKTILSNTKTHITPSETKNLVLNISKQVYRFIKYAWSWVTVRGKEESRHSLRKTVQIYTDYLINQIIFPLLIARKTFQCEPYDAMIQTASGRSDAYVFCNELEVAAHRILLKTDHVYVARFPTLDKCRCTLDAIKKTTILCALSGWEHHALIPTDVLALYYRDLKTIISSTNANNIHLRRHPGFGPNDGWAWAGQLHHYLTERGIRCEVIGCERALPEIACEYLGSVGVACSSALREIRASCSYTFAICLSSVSKSWYRQLHKQNADPKFILGTDGIGWIEEDGSYDPSIFEQKLYIPKTKKSIVDIVLEQSQHAEEIQHSQLSNRIK